MDGRVSTVTTNTEDGTAAIIDTPIEITFDGGVGNDIVMVYNNTFAHADGGSGTDTFLWNGANLDLSAISSKIDNVEIISLSDPSATAQSLTLTLNDLFLVTDGSMTNNQHNLYIQGNTGDSVTIADATSNSTYHWTLAQSNVTYDGVTYDVYDVVPDATATAAYSNYHLLVQTDMTVTNNL